MTYRKREFLTVENDSIQTQRKSQVFPVCKHVKGKGNGEAAGRMGERIGACKIAIPNR